MLMLTLLAERAVAEPLPSRVQARADFERGLSAAQRHDWPAALAAFSDAYRLAAEPAVLFNLAGAQLRCGKLLASNTNYRRLLASEALSPAERQAASEQVARIERRIPRLRVRIGGLRGDDRIVLDRVRLYPDELDRDMWLDPGPHQLTIFRTRGSAQVHTLTLSEGEARVLAFRLP